MISVEEAIEIILKEIRPLGTEKVDIINSLGRVLAEDIYSGHNIPPWDNSAMDGYAVRAEDVSDASQENPAILTVLEDLPAGYMARNEIKRGEAIRIMTGAPMPKGADTVVIVEDTEQAEGKVKVYKPYKKGKNIRRAGEDVKEGALVLPKGSIISPASVGMMAGVGRSFVHLYQRARVAILATGDEVVDIDEEIEEGKIINSNSYTLASQVRECGAIPILLGIARDTPEHLKEKLKEGMNADLIVSSGGVSVGDYDFVKKVLSELGSAMKFWKVAMKPGKPLAFGTIGGKPAFGLPGNSVSSMIAFEQFVRPALLKMMGHIKIYRPTIEATLKEDLKKEPGRKYFISAMVEGDGKGNYYVAKAGEQGSGILSSMVKANGLIIFDDDQKEAKAGEKIKVQLLNKFFDGREKPWFL